MSQYEVSNPTSGQVLGIYAGATDREVYTPIHCVTGALHAQPQDGAVRIEACCDFTGDYKVLFDMRGALDAPVQIPSGGVIAQEFAHQPSSGRLLVGHVYRDGWHS